MGMKRALHLICELGCGKVSKFEKEVAVNPTIEAQPLEVSIAKMNELLGIEVPNEEILRHLDALGFAPEIDGDRLHVMVPPYREDIDGHVQDIAEEVIRSYGYEHIVPRFLDNAQVTAGGRNPDQKRKLKLKNTLVKQNYYESMFYSFFSPKDLDMIHLPEDAPERHAIRLMNPISEDLSLMRTILAPSMINAVVRNLRRGNMSGRFFELASIFKAKELPLTEYPEERTMLCIGAFGENETFFTAKGAPEAVAQAFGMSFTYEKAEKPFLHPGMTANILCNGKVVGYLGRLSHNICAELAIERPVFLCEMDYELLTECMNERIVYKPLSKFATETRDLALVMEESITCRDVEDAIRSSCKYISEVALFDVYRSAQIGEGKKSMAFNIVFTPEDHEFTSEEIDK